MNRKLKFRIWDSEQKRMFFPTSNLFPDNPDDFGYPQLSQYFDITSYKLIGYQMFPDKYRFSDRCVVQQFTGLKDGRGKELFEGDIIEQLEFEDWGDDTGEMRKGFIKYVESIGNIPITGFKVFYNLNNAEWTGHEILSGFKIIGNIYEDSELLK